MAKSAPSTRSARTTSAKSPRAGASSGGGLPAPDLRQAVDLVMDLMAIPGPSGQEGQVIDYIIGKLRKAGLPAALIQQDKPPKNTPVEGLVGNLVVKLPGTIKAPRRLLMAHLDTVPICVGSKPKRNGDFVRSADPATGLGADDRAGAAVILNTALEVLRRRLPTPPLTFFWPVQEEIGLYGARNAKLSMLGSPKLAFNWDGGTPAKITIGATGGYRMKIDIQGLASHAGNAPEQGVSAIAIAGLAIAELQNAGWHGDIHKSGKHGTSNIGVISGGAATNVVTDRVTLKAEARSHDPQFRNEIILAICGAFERAARAVQSAQGIHGKVTIDGQLDYEAFRLSDNEPCILAAEAAVRAAGLEPIRAISNGGLDANWMTARGIPTVTLGCGQMNPHTISERLDVPAFEAATRIALSIATADR